MNNKNLALICWPAGVLLLLSLVGRSQAVAQSQDFSIKVGEEEYVLGPTANYLDSSLFTVPLNNQGSIRGYSANGHTHRFSGSLASPISEGITLRAGPGGAFDECGAWLSSVYKLTAEHWLGWYHAEYDCHYDQGITHKSMAFTESFDGGITWAKTGYPNSQVLTSYNPQVNEGDGHILPIGDYFYMFYLSESDWKIRVARASKESEGRPGSWYKYFNGSFSEPGLGGNSSPVNENLKNGFVVFNSYLDEYVSVLASGRWGFFISQSVNKDIFNWKVFSQTILPFVSYTTDSRVDKWVTNRSSSDLQLYSYPSIIGLDGDSNTAGQSFYLYYLKLFPGEGFDKRYLLRRKIMLNKNPTDNYFAKLALVSYEKQNPKKTKVSTEIAKPSEGYQKKELLGYVLPYEEAGFRPLYECFIPIWNDYLISTADPSLKNWEHCESDGDVFVRKIGYVSANATAKANVPLYRCFDQQNSDHFLSEDVECEGKVKEFLIGYALAGENASIPTPTSGLRSPDIDGNGTVGESDRVWLNGCYDPLGSPSDDHCRKADLNNNNVVNALDYSLLLKNWSL